MAASAAAGQFYNINGPNGSWIAKVIAISKEPFRSRCGQLLYRTPKRGELPFEDGPYIQVEWYYDISIIYKYRGQSCAVYYLFPPVNLYVK